MGVIEAAEEMKAPVIIQVYPRLINEQVGYYIRFLMRRLRDDFKRIIPVIFDDLGEENV